MGYPVNPPSEQQAALAPAIIRDLTTTRQSVSYPSGALWLVLSYRLLPGATAVANQFARVVINAASDSDANGKLALDNAFIPLCQGDDLVLSASPADPITRVEVISSAAAGAEKTLLCINAGVVA